jgi:hypothetical protein
MRWGGNAGWGWSMVSEVGCLVDFEHNQGLPELLVWVMIARRFS